MIDPLTQNINIDRNLFSNQYVQHLNRIYLYF